MAPEDFEHAPRPPETDRPEGRNRPERPDPHLHPLARSGLYLVLFVFLQVAVGVPVLLIWAVATDTNLLLMAERGTVPGGLALFVYAALAPVIVAFTAAWARWLDGKRLRDLGARLPARPGVQTVASLVAVAAVLGGWLAVAAAFGEVRVGGLAPGFREGAGPFEGVAGGAALLGLLFLGFLVQGGVEEWVFRGYVFHALRERWSWASAAGGSSAAFAILHGLNPSVSLPGLVNTFLLGLVLAAVTELTGSLLAPAVLHGWWNFAMACVLSVPVSGVRLFHLLELEAAGPEAVTGGGYGPEGSWALTALVVPVLVVLAARVDRRGGTPEGPQ
jgi:hypothetical protein